MKTISVLLALLSCYAASAATWTIHGFRDNAAGIGFLTSDLHARGTSFQWDWTWDQLYPESTDSGLYFTTNDVWYRQTEYQDTLTADVPEEQLCYYAWVSGPAPDYNWGEYIAYPTLGDPGEYWIDFSSDGTLRWSSTQPADFGKWAWDGSVNPSWVEPLARKGHGKGHK